MFFLQEVTEETEKLCQDYDYDYDACGYGLGPTCFTGMARATPKVVDQKGWPKGHPGFDMNFTVNVA
jgi:hypothetical protein